MRLRTLTNQQKHPLKEESPEPSTSRFNDSPSSSISPKNSPASPVQRVAKRNARTILNIGNSGGAHAAGDYSAESLVGTIPDFAVRKLHEFVPAIGQLNEEHELDDGLLTDLQFQLEKLLADNIDWQKNIHGEMTFLSTGDYPTDDLRSRPMPSYELRSSDLNGAHHQADLEENQPSLSYVDHHFKQDEDEAGSDVISSMDEKELDEPYCVLDIPHRFWTWAREYIGHVDEKFLHDFKENFFDRYQPEQMEEFFLNEPFKYKPSKHNKESPQHKTPQLNGVHSSSRKTSKTSLTGQMNGCHAEEASVSPPAKKRLSTQATRDQLLKSLRTEDNASDLMKRLVAAYIDEQANTSAEPKKAKPGRKSYDSKPLSPSKPSSSSKKSKQPKKKKKKVNGELNGKLNGHSNGLESTDDETVQDVLTNSDLMETFGQALADCVLPVGEQNGHDADAESETEESEQDEPEQDEPSTPSTNMENFELIKLKLDSKHRVEDLDEVSSELLKAQQRLEQLTKKISPTLNKCKKELEAEHAYWLTTRALNSVDDELFRLANQIPMGATQIPEDLQKQCTEVWDQRQQFLLAHYIRDHVKFVQFSEKAAADAQRAQVFMGTPDAKTRSGHTTEKSPAKTRSNRKKSSAMKKELLFDAMEE